jgi:hypothetical protein
MSRTPSPPRLTATMEEIGIEVSSLRNSDAVYLISASEQLLKTRNSFAENPTPGLNID